MSVDNLFSIVGFLTEIAVIGMLVYRRVWRRLPVFLVYCVWALLSDAAAFTLKLALPQSYGIRFYISTTLVDLSFQLSVLVELAWSVLRPLRRGLSRRAFLVVAAFILGVGAAIWPFSGADGIDLPSRAWRLVLQLQQTVSILRVLFFLGLATCSHLLGLGWRDRELQVASGFGFYSLVSLGVAAANAHLETAAQYKQLYWAVAFSFLGSLCYWVFSFAQPEVERREFSPQATQMLMAVANSAHIARAQLADYTAARQNNL